MMVAQGRLSVYNGFIQAHTCDRSLYRAVVQGQVFMLPKRCRKSGPAEGGVLVRSRSLFDEQDG